MSENGKLKWANERRRLSDLIPWPRNPRYIDRDEASKLAESLEEFSQVETIAIGPGNELYNGHQRLNVWAEKFGDIEVDVRVSNRPLTEKEREKLTVILHRGTVGRFDFDELANGFDLDELLEWGFTEEELEIGGFDIDGEKGEVEDVEAELDRGAELRAEWGVNVGDVWRCGARHLLACGDCRDEEVVKALFEDGGGDSRAEGEKARIVMTSPPYWVGMEYEQEKTEDEVIGFIHEAAGAWMPYVIVDQSRVIINTATGSARALNASNDVETFILLDWWRDAMIEHGFKIRHIRVWVKQGGFPAPRAPETDVVDQHWEFIATFYNPKGKRVGQNAVHEPWAQTGYWDFAGKAREAGHVASYPVQLPERCLRLYGKDGDVVLDPFAGASTTMIVCEQLNMRCRGIEIVPEYVAISLDRYYKLTGVKPIKIR